MNAYDQAANNALFDVGGKLSALILNGISNSHPWKPNAELLAKLTEAQQAVFAAQRLIEAADATGI